ncbi:MAG: ureidoglycolate lyase [Rhizobiaceae bacterium]
MKHIPIEPLTKEAFAPYGELIEKIGSEQIMINRGKCIRHHALAIAEVAGDEASVVISIFAGQPYALPHVLDMVERHPLGSQAFYPLGDKEWLVIVCEDESGVPVEPRAFRALPHQGVNLKRNQWHGVLTPLHEPSDFLVVDRGGPGDNLVEYDFDQPFTVGS